VSSPWQNPAEPLDVNNDTFVSPAGDVLPVVNELNNRAISDEAGRLRVRKYGGGLLIPLIRADRVSESPQGLTLNCISA
jgi:hypothetical protein